MWSVLQIRRMAQPIKIFVRHCFTKPPKMPTDPYNVS